MSTMSFKVVVWNMDASRRRRNPKGWQALADLEPDIALLNEAVRPQPQPGVGLTVRGRTSTRGRDHARPWASLVASPHELEPVDARVKRVPFGTSRPGAWTAWVVSVPADDGRVERVTAISLYGLLDEMSDASVHRSLSEIAPIFDDRRYNDLVLLGGDLNTWTGWDRETQAGHLARDRAVLQRIEAYGLVDCLKAKRTAGRLKSCPCRPKKKCTHTRTRLDARNDVPYQMDYLYASPALAERLGTCAALDTDEWFSRSDHAPIVARFKGARNRAEERAAA
jgi:hypothetical protein